MPGAPAASCTGTQINTSRDLFFKIILFKGFNHQSSIYVLLFVIGILWLLIFMAPVNSIEIIHLEV
jgi:hypothetical protein